MSLTELCTAARARGFFVVFVKPLAGEPPLQRSGNTLLVHRGQGARLNLMRELFLRRMPCPSPDADEEIHGSPHLRLVGVDGW